MYIIISVFVLFFILDALFWIVFAHVVTAVNLPVRSQLD